MKKEIFNYEKKKSVNYSGSVQVDKKDSKIVETLGKLVFVATIIAIVLALFKVVTPEGAVLIFTISMVIGVLCPLIYLTIKYFVIRKTPLEKHDNTSEIEDSEEE